MFIPKRWRRSPRIRSRQTKASCHAICVRTWRASSPTPLNCGVRHHWKWAIASGTAHCYCFRVSRPVAIIQQEIRSLSLAEKEEVLRTLLEELDGPPDPDVEAAWLKEVERRAAEIDDGKVRCIPAEEVFRKLDAQLKK